MTDDYNPPNVTLYDRATKNENGDYTFKRETDGFGTIEVNVSELFKPGRRKTSNVKILVAEARIYADRENGDGINPAFPTTNDVAEEALEKIENEGLDPAWLLGPHEGNSHD